MSNGISVDNIRQARITPPPKKKIKGVGYYKISVSHGVQNPIPPLDPRMKGITNRLSPSCLCISHVCLLVSLSFSHSVPLFIMVYMYIILTSSLIKPFRSTPPPLFVRSGSVNRKHWLGKMLIYKQRLSSVFFFFKSNYWRQI